MVYPGKFTEQLLADRLDRVSLSFLADSLHIRRGGVAANIAVGLARLGIPAVLAAAVGKDFGEYGSWLRDNGVETASLHISETLHTARFVCTTDADHNQIATFYAGAMAEARTISIAAVAERAGRPNLVFVAPNEPEAMLRHTDECRLLGLPFAADPSQQLAILDAEDTRQLVDGARYLFTNEYEAALLQERTGWNESEVLKRADTWIVTRGGDGVDILSAGQEPLRIAAVPTGAAADPTGVGDAFRAGFLAGSTLHWPYERSARLGCALATLVLETVGPQDYTLTPGLLLDKIRGAYGDPTAREIERSLPL
ncbi:carbohydrate kinase family protein [Streptomyces sp. DG2A-72]|uniref:carbohydrate kinase family protein n=1 Tax=Streptomyces sp. DG2A-72 TaxID=3051386 RepID=UPI00265C608C|nr:carbohydrate kinase family protein [Streptomyces sp. DG2A-72]MDO0937288.1 carbohydrate kinase family protein [Streptomyces sp. DG2A-72]